MQTGMTGNYNPCFIQPLVIQTPIITGWAPILPALDLTAAQVPSKILFESDIVLNSQGRSFSVEQEISPFVVQVMSVPVVVAYYIIVIGLWSFLWTLI